MMANRAFEIKIDPASINAVVNNINQLSASFKAALEILMNTAAVEMVNYAKSNKPWVNRTGNAVNGLRQSVEWLTDEVIVITVYHTMDYGVWLELAHQRKYKILEQCIRSKAPELVSAAGRLL